MSGHDDIEDGPSWDARITEDEILVVESRDVDFDFTTVDVNLVEGLLLRNRDGGYGVGWRFNGEGAVWALTLPMAREMILTLRDILAAAGEGEAGGS